MAKEFAVLILPITAFLLIIFFLHNIWRIIPSGLIFRYITSKRTWKILIKIIYSGEFQITDDQTYGHGAFSIGIDFLEFIFDPFFRERQNDRKFKSRAVCWSCDFRHCYTLWFGNLYELIFFLKNLFQTANSFNLCLDQLYFSTRVLLSRSADANVQSVRNSPADAGFSIQSDPDCIITMVFGTVWCN